MRALRVAGIVCGAAIVVLLAVSMFATELTRVLVRNEMESPIPLPLGVEIRHSDRLVKIIGKGTSSGEATAVTLGEVILVRRAFTRLSVERRIAVIRHELRHVQQREEHGRLYLPLYGVLYLRYGYRDHPFERDAFSMRTP